MPSRHSKNSGDRHHFTYHEKRRAGLGSVSQRLGVESQLPFGYCSLSMHPAVEPVVSPSGHLYSREFILEYLLTKSKELTKLREQYNAQQAKLQEEHESKQRAQRDREVGAFCNRQDTAGADTVRNIGTKRPISNTGGASVVDSINKGTEKSNGALVPYSATAAAERKDAQVEASRDGQEKEGAVENEYSYKLSRRKVIDDTNHEEEMAHLKTICPWLPQFTPQAQESLIGEPPKRPPSPFSGRPLRAKDLVPVDLLQESSGSANSSVAKFLCPVTRKTITNQKVVLIKTTGAHMLEDAAKQLAYPSMVCPITGKRFKQSDVLELVPAASGFAASGQVKATVHRPSIN